MLIPVLTLASAYLVGSIPVSYLIARFAGQLDLRRIGSGNIGATNVYRALGLKWAVAAFLGDALKGALPVLAALGLQDSLWLNQSWLAGVGLAAVLGHLFPPWLKFRGGKGVAASFGVMLVLAPSAALGVFALWALLAALVKVVSVASLAAAVALPVMVYFLDSSGPKFGLAVLLSGLVIISHHENLRRLWRGEEKPLRREPPPPAPGL